MNDGHGLQPSVREHFQPDVQINEPRRVFIVKVELEKVVWQPLVMDGMLRVEPFTVKNELAAEHGLQNGTLNRSPLLEQVVLRMHALCNLVPTALEDRKSVV